MGASGSKYDVTSDAGGIKPQLPLPPPSQDAIWTKIQLSNILGCGAPLSGGHHILRVASERGNTDGDNVRENGGVPRSLSCSSTADDEDMCESWLETALCLSMATLQRKEMALLVERAKDKLFWRLSRFCDQDDVFCENVTQRIHALRCAHAAMTRQRVREAKQASEMTAVSHGGRNCPQLSNEQTGNTPAPGVGSGETRLGLQLFFSLLDFVREPECGQEQLVDFLDQIVPVLSNLPPLCLASSSESYLPQVHRISGEKSNSAPSVINSLREFLVSCTTMGTGCKDLHQTSLDDGASSAKATRVEDSARRNTALSALTGLVAARGRASDLLMLVKVLLRGSFYAANISDISEADDNPFISGAGDEPRRDVVMIECSAKRRPTPRIKAHAFRQPLPVDDGNEEETQPSVLIAPSRVFGVGPTEPNDPSASHDVDGDPWINKQIPCVLRSRDSGKSADVHSIKRKNCKGERIQPVQNADPEPWQVNEATIKKPPTTSRTVMHATMGAKVWGVEPQRILPLLRQLQDAKPKQSSLLGSSTNDIKQREVWTCGQNSYGELGHSDTKTRRAHCMVKILDGREIIDIAAGNEHTVVLSRTGEVFTAGYNDNGQCGQGTTQRVGILTRIPVLAGKKAVQVHAYNGCEHTLVVLEDGRVFSFGYNYRGQLGHGNTTSESIAKPVRGLDGGRVTNVSCSYYHSIISCEHGEVYSFGRNDFGQLGSGDTIDRKLPSPVECLRGQHVTSLACGQYHTVVSTTEIGVQSCGKNDYGQLGVESTNFQPNLVLVKGPLEGTSVKHLRCGYYHTIVLAAGGHVLGFGRNDYGQLGLGHVTQRMFGPKLIEGAEGKNICRVSAGCYHTVLIGADGMLYVFGRNHHGQLGTGDTSERHFPFPVDTFLGKQVSKVAAGFYHTIVLTGAGDDGTIKLGATEGVHSFSPDSIIEDPTLSLPRDGHNDLIADDEPNLPAETDDSRAGTPEVSSPVREREAKKSEKLSSRAPDTSRPNLGSLETTNLASTGRSICLRDGRVNGQLAAVLIMAHMDRLAQFFAVQNGDFPVIGAATGDAAKLCLNRSGNDEREIDQNIYCIDLCPTTFDLLSSILASMSQQEVFDDSFEDNDTPFQSYVVIATLRVLGANLTRLLQSSISAHVLQSMNELSKQSGNQDANELRLDDWLGNDPVSGTVLCESTRHVKAATGTRGVDIDLQAERVTRDGTGHHIPGHDRTNEGCGDEDCGYFSDETRDIASYRDVLSRLRQRLLVLVNTDYSFIPGTSAAVFVQREAAAVLILGLELFFPSQAEQFLLLSKLINTPAVSEHDNADHSTDACDSVDLLDNFGSFAARGLILDPLLSRLCDDALASKLMPYGSKEEDGCSVCTVVKLSEPELSGHRVTGASARLLDMQLKLLMGEVAHGTLCRPRPSDAFLEQCQPQLFAPRHADGGSPCTVLQLNGSATDRTESFDLESPHKAPIGLVDDDDGRRPLRTKDLILNLILTLTKHMMHWAAGNHVEVDPALWNSRVLELGPGGGGVGHRAAGQGIDNRRATSTPGWLNVRAKGLCDRATAVVLDGLDRAPSSWRCFIDYAQLVLDRSVDILETALATESGSPGDCALSGCCAPTASEEVGGVENLKNSLVGVLLPVVVDGLLPFAHIPVFARRLLQVVTSTVILLDAACRRCPIVLRADACFVSTRNGEAPKTEPQSCFTRGKNGKLGAGGGSCDRKRDQNAAGAEARAAGGLTCNVDADRCSLPWLLSLAKTAALLAGRYAATLTIGDCGISPFLEAYFQSTSYLKWLDSDLFTGGCDPLYEALMLSPLNVSIGEDANSCVENQTSAAADDSASLASHGMSEVLPDEKDVAIFLEEMAGGHGRGNQFMLWLHETFASSDPAYVMIKRHATVGRDGEMLERVERVVVAAMLKHSGLDRDAVVFSSPLKKNGNESCGRGKTGGAPVRRSPRKFARLWKSVAEMIGWLWHVRSKLMSADAEQSAIHNLFVEASDCCTILLLLRSAGRIPAALGTRCIKLNPRIVTPTRQRWLKATCVVRATIRWRSFASGGKRAEAIALVPRFVRCMLEIRISPPKLRNHHAAEQDEKRKCASLGCLLILLVLVLHNHQRAITRASGFRAFRTLAVAVQMPSLVADVLTPLPHALRTPHLLNRHHLTHLSAVSRPFVCRVTAAFHALYSKLRGILGEYCPSVDERSVASCALRRDAVEMRSHEVAQGDTCQPLHLRDVNARVVLVVLDAWGLTIHAQDWKFLESEKVMETISRVCTFFAQDRFSSHAQHVCVGNDGVGDATASGLPAKRVGRMMQTPGLKVSEEGQRVFSACHTAAWTLFRALAIQLYGLGTGRHVDAGLTAGKNPADSTLNFFQVELSRCIRNTNADAERARNGVVHGRNRGPPHNERLPSQAILEFASPGIGRIDGSPSPERNTGGHRSHGVGTSHKRRCQELVSNPRRLMNMENGLVFPAEQVLNNPRSSDFSITFWFLLGQDRTGHHRTVLVRGHRSERWPVLLLRDTDNRLEVCFGIPSMGNLCERLTSKASIPVNVWTHVGLISEQNKLRLYFDGVLDCQRTSTGALRANRHPLYVGKVPDGAVRLDGVRGGIEGSIAHLRYFTRALSPIHVHIICDPGPPESAKVQDQYCYNICACLVVICRSGYCQYHLRQRHWLILLLQVLRHGTVRVQQAICRLLREILPKVKPTTMANISVTSSVAMPFLFSNDRGIEDEAAHAPAFITYLLRLVGASSWYVRAAVGFVEKGNEATEEKDEDCAHLTVAQVLSRKQVTRFLPRTISLGYARRPVTAESFVMDNSQYSFRLDNRRALKATSHHSPPVLSPKTAHDLCMIGAELVALVQTLSATVLWTSAAVSALSRDLARMYRFLDGTGSFISPDPQTDETSTQNCATGEDHLDLAGGEAALQVIGGNIEFLRAGICAKVRDTDERCVVLTIDKATSTVRAMLYPGGEDGAGQWIQRYNANELELQDTDGLASEAMVAFSEAPVSLPESGAIISGQEYVFRMATSFFHSSPLPRSSTEGPPRESDTMRAAYQEILLAQCRSRLSRVILCASQDETWAGRLAENVKLLSELRRVATVSTEGIECAVGEEDLTKYDIVAMQSRLLQMLGAPGSGALVVDKIVDFASSCLDGLSASSGAGIEHEGRGPGHIRSAASFGRAWVENLGCPFCPEEELSVAGIIEHVLNKHSTDVRRVPCPVCITEKGDDTAHDLPTHLELVHFNVALQERQSFVQPFLARRGGEGRGGRSVPPPTDLVEQLMVIGFPENWCTMALRENNNDVVNASAWLVDNLDMLSSLNTFESSDDRADDTTPLSPRLGNDSATAQSKREHVFCRGEDTHQEESVLGESSYLPLEHEREQAYGDVLRREQTYRDKEEGKQDSDGDEGDDEEDHDGGEEEEDDDSDVVDNDDDDDNNVGGDGQDDGVEGKNRHRDAASDSEEDCEEACAEAGADTGSYGRRAAARREHAVVVTPSLTAVDVKDNLAGEQYEIDRQHGFEGGPLATNQAQRFFPSEDTARLLIHSPPHDERLSRSLQVGAIKSEIAAMELGRLTEVWFLAELSLTNFHCRAAFLNVLLRWPRRKPLNIVSLGDATGVVQLIRSFVFNVKHEPVLFNDVLPHVGMLRPTPNGACAPSVLGVFSSLLVLLIRSEREHRLRSVADESGGQRLKSPNAETTKTVTGTPEGVVAGSKNSLWGDTLAAQLISGCLNELDAAAAGDSFSDLPWDHENPVETQRLGSGKPNLELLRWLLDLLLSAGCDGIFTEAVFSRLSNCINSPNQAAKEVAMYALASIATKWCEHLAVDEPNNSQGRAENSASLLGLPSPLAMEETFQRHMAVCRVRSALVTRIAVERRPGGHFFSKYTQTLASLYMSVHKLNRLLQRERQRRRSVESIVNDLAGSTELSTPAVLYCTDSCVALTWIPVRYSAALPGIRYEVQMATRQLGLTDSSSVFRCVYLGKRLRCRIDDLTPGQVYRFRVRAILSDILTTGWSTVTTTETQQGVAFHFDPSNSGPAIFVNGNELSASFDSNESWSTILGTTLLVTGSNYWELRLDKSPTAYLFVGVATRDADLTTFLGGDDHGWGFIGDRALYHKRTKVKGYGERFGQSDIIGVTLDMDHGTLSFSKNGHDLGVAFEGLVGGLYPAIAFYNQGQQVSLVQSAFNCPGAGITIVDSPLDTSPEAMIEVCDVMDAMATGQPLPGQWIGDAWTRHLQWLAGSTERHKTILGFELQFDVSNAACMDFGLKARARVRTPRGNATVIGVCNGVLWFHVDGESGAWFFTVGKLRQGRVGGFFSVSPSGTAAEDSSSTGGQMRNEEKREDSNTFERRNAMQQEARFPHAKENLVSGFEINEAGDCGKWTPRADGYIVSMLCDYADRRQVSAWNLSPAEVMEILAPVRPTLDLMLGAGRGYRKSNAGPVPDGELLCRVSLLKYFNHQIIGILPLADLADGVQISDHVESHTFLWGSSTTKRGLGMGVGHSPTRGLGPLISRLRHSIFFTTKHQTLLQAVRVTTTHAKKAEDEYDYPEDLPQVTVNRLKAAAGRESNDIEVRLEASVFHQLYRELRLVDPSLLRMGYTHPMDDSQRRTFKVKFEGEGVDDYGGPYREIFTQIAAELTSTLSENSGNPEYDHGLVAHSEVCVLPVLNPTPISAAEQDATEELKFTVPANVSEQRRLDLYKFFGQMIGIALRCRVTAPWRLSQVIWKGLVGEALGEEDLQHVDSDAYYFVQTIKGHIRDAHRQIQFDEPLDAAGGRSREEALSRRENVAFTWAAPAHGEIVELRPGGQNLGVAPEDLPELVRNVVHMRVHEGDKALFAVRDGLTSVVPAAVLPLFTWKEVELQVCGRAGVDVDLLQANTEYDDDLSPSDLHIQSFWRVLRSFDDQDRAQFLRFVWARSRLPTRAADFHQKFKIHSPTGDGPKEDPDKYLPKAHTCFFSINLPRYSCDETMKQKLRYTMYNCIEMDADFRLADDELSGWASGNTNAGRAWSREGA